MKIIIIEKNCEKRLWWQKVFGWNIFCEQVLFVKENFFMWKKAMWEKVCGEKVCCKKVFSSFLEKTFLRGKNHDEKSPTFEIKILENKVFS